MSPEDEAVYRALHDLQGDIWNLQDTMRDLAPPEELVVSADAAIAHANALLKAAMERRAALTG